MGLVAVSVALVQTWMTPRVHLVNLWSGLALVGVLTLSFTVLRNRSLNSFDK
jgi:hypothetical protein